MNDHRYILQPYRGMSTRHHCPECKKRDRTFTLYIDVETGEPVNDIVGKCDRLDNCGYHYTPKQFFQDTNALPEPSSFVASTKQSKIVVPKQADISFISKEVFKASLAGYERNHFINFLITLFGEKAVNETITNYFIGSSNSKWHGATVFWQIDLKGNIRSGRVMLYNALTGKRVKEPKNCITWAHTVLKSPNFTLRQCFFGEHLLRDKTKPVAIVESEKTAVIASLYLPQFIWLASGGKDGLGAAKCTALKGRKVTLFPDINGLEKWTQKAKELSSMATFFVSNLLEEKATEAEREQGLDLADYLIAEALRRKPEDLTPALPIVETEAVQPPEIIEPQKRRKHDENHTKALWNLDFNFSKLPTVPIKLNPWESISNPAAFLKSHLEICRRNNGNKTFLPYYNRLRQLEKLTAE